MTETFWPEGLTRMMSISSGKPCDRPFKLRSTLLTRPVRPETAIVEGYGAAGPWSGIVMEVALVNDVVTGRKKAKVAVPRLFAPSWSWRVALITPPETDPEVKVKFRETA